MENIYKIKIKSNPDPRNLYPSERRYSSSIVLGFSVMFFALFVTSLLLGTLVIRNMTVIKYNETIITTNTTITNDFTEDRLVQRVTEELKFLNEIDNDNDDENYANTPSILSAGSFIMSTGCLLSAITGLIAWKHWYIDNNITWFFLASGFSVITSAISLLLIAITFMEIYDTPNDVLPIISPALASNILITSILSLIWSILATNMGFKGMKSNYPDDIVISKGGGRIEVCTERKGNRIGKVVPPDILNHFPKTGKLAKYFPKKNKENNYLPKAESTKEYEERINKYLAAQPDGDDK